MPKIVLFIPEIELLHYIAFYEQGTSQVIENILTWMLTNIQRTVQSCKDMLIHKNKGAVALGEPVFIWVKLLIALNQMRQP